MSPGWNYSHPPTADYESLASSDTRLLQDSSQRKFLQRIKNYSLILGIALTTFSILGSVIWTSKTLTSYRSSSLGRPSPTSCKSPILRKEWRTLTRNEKLAYIDAVQCLRTLPSVLGLNQTHYDDFPYVHRYGGDITHGTVQFFPWHRYFVHIYEKSLKEKCGYANSVPYWDWTLDWRSFADAPVWNAEDGFGGDGGIYAPQSVGLGHCVVDGPFANMTALYSNRKFKPHCFSRGFLTGAELVNKMQGIRPEVVESILNIEDYEEFTLRMEGGPHQTIPQSIRGDFRTFTSPYDPVFFLHHSYMDWIWLRWQRMHQSEADPTWSNARAGMLHVGGLAPDVAVLDVASVRSSLLCYRYGQ